jgi:DNA-binding transcriptional ArsR family regulator
VPPPVPSFDALPFDAVPFDAVLDAVGEPSRRAILRRLGAGPSSVADLARELPVTRPAVSQHLKVLLDTGLVTFDRVGTRNLYRLRPEGLAPLRAWLDELWDAALASYAARAQEQADELARRPER